MVLQDLHHSQHSHNPIDALRAPAIFDRLAAALIDFICYFFVVFVILSPLRREMAMARLTESESDFAFSYSLSLFIFFVICVLYQSVFIAWKGATPGMMALKLRVVGVWENEKPGWTSSLLRGVMWTLGGALLCIPYLGVFTNERRRPIHDRLADTEMISLNGRVSAKPSLSVKSAMRGFAMSLTVCVLFLLGIEISRMGKSQRLARRA